MIDDYSQYIPTNYYTAIFFLFLFDTYHVSYDTQLCICVYIHKL